MTDNENAALRTEIERLRKLCEEWARAASVVTPSDIRPEMLEKYARNLIRQAEEVAPLLGRVTRAERDCDETRAMLLKVRDALGMTAGGRGFSMAEESKLAKTEAEIERIQVMVGLLEKTQQLLREAPLRHEKGCAIVVTHRVNGVQQPCDCGVDAWRESVRVVLEEGEIPAGYSISLPPEEALRVFLINPTAENAITLAHILGVRKPT